MRGLLLVDKPADWTSFDVVNKIRRIIADAEGVKPKSIKVGHSGTLDPFATGLLILLVGKEYTKKASEFSKLDKTYEVTLKLGATSSTGDPEGEIEAVSGATPTLEAVQEAIGQFRGQIEQVPPAFSAIKIDGQRAYKLAREGKEVKIEPRQVTINRLEIVSYDYPEVKLVADVSSGTYIRALVEDIGKVLETGAYTTGLRRISIGSFQVTLALLQPDLTENTIENSLTEIQ